MPSILHKKIKKHIKFDVKYTLRGGSWLMLGYVATLASSILISYVYANFLSPETYGQYKYILSAGLLIGTFSLTGTSTTIVQATAKKIGGFFHYIKAVNFKYSFLASSLAAVTSIYYYTQGNLMLATGLAIVGLFQPFFNNASLLSSYLTGTQQFKLNAFCHTIKTVFTTAVIITTALVTENIGILLLSYFSAHVFIGYVLQFIFIPKEEATATENEKEELLKYTKHTSIQNIVTGISNQLDKILIFQFLGAVELAVYTFATALPDQYKSITKSIDAMILPRFSQYSPKAIRSGMLYKSIVYFFFLLACLVAYIVAAPFVFSTFFPQYESSVLLSQIYVAGIIFGIGGLPLAALKTEMSNKKLYRFNLFTSLFQIVSLLAFLPTFGLLGAVYAKVSYRAVVCLSAFILYYKK